MKLFWLVLGFDALRCEWVVPDPCLFETEREARTYCRRHSREGSILYGCRKAYVGRMGQSYVT